MSRMSQALHIFKKDVRRYWPFVAVLTVVLTVDAWTDVGTSGFGTRTARFVEGFRSQAVMLLTALIAVIVVHEDDVSSRGGFWSSRPIAPMGMLGAKLMFVGVFLLGVPLAFQALEIVRHGSVVGLQLHLAESALLQGTVLVAALVMAAVTRDLKSALFLGVLVGFGVTVGIDLLRTGIGSYQVGLSASRQLLGAAWVLVAGGVLITSQVVMRNTRLALVGMVGASMVVVLITAQSPVNFWPEGRSQLRLAEDLIPQLEIQRVFYSPANPTSRGPGVEGIDAVVTTVPNGLSFAPAGQRIRVFVDGEAQTGPENIGRPYLPAQRFVPMLDGYSWFGNGDDWAQFDVRVLSRAPGDLAAALAAAGEVEISAGFRAYRPVVVGRLDLVAGATLRTGGRKVVVDSVSGTSGYLGLQVTTSWVSSSFASISVPTRNAQIRVMLVNDERKEYLLPSEGGGQVVPHGLILLGPRVRSSLSSLNFKLGPIPGTDVELTREWFDDAKILVYRSDYVGHFEASVTADMSTWSLPKSSVPILTAGQLAAGQVP